MDRSQQIPPLVEQGLSIYRIGAELGISPSTARYWIKKLGLKTVTPPPGSRGPVEDLTGQRFGFQVVMRMVKTGKRGAWRAVCQCDCGSPERDIPRSALLREMSTSCGCRTEHYEKMRGSNNSSFSGYGELPGRHWGKIRLRASKKHRSFTLTIEEAWDLFLSQDRKCALTGLHLEFGRAHYPEETTASLDRIDSAQGYEVGNVQWVHKSINFMKGSLQQDEFIRFCRLVTENTHDHLSRRRCLHSGYPM